MIDERNRLDRLSMFLLVAVTLALTGILALLGAIVYSEHDRESEERMPVRTEMAR